ncbi:hypothetical protein GT037_004713 [Alternaria burnsii]|uniref:Uncharacterized protein n=1 Tax=Alternaria burnsii TaxID=1187904 RepID=A0A8H7BA07_9PLEO|nr:uncharacterized protein GT037_004713 [Alternaria burnsii]KAF7677854.1 hypothetical protein GT037_004713 [Alternaria burnsii]
MCVVHASAAEALRNGRRIGRLGGMKRLRADRAIGFLDESRAGASHDPSCRSLVI